MDETKDLQDRRSALDALLCFDIYGAHQAFGRLYKPFLAPLGLTYPQYLVLLLLDAEKPMTVGEVGATLGLESNTLTPLLKRMEQAGLVTRIRDTSDERRVLIGLTDKGIMVQAQAREVPRCMAESSGLDLAEIRDLQHRLRGLTRQLDGAKRP